MKIAEVILAVVVMAAMAGETVWRVWDWPKRDPGWSGVGRICGLFLLALLVTVT